MIRKVVKVHGIKAMYDPKNHPRASYSLDGINWFNHGDLCEMLVKAGLGLKPSKDGNTPFDKGCDIPEYNANVKSFGASLTDKKLGTTFDEIVNNYMANVVAENCYWAEDEGDVIVWYEMDKALFEEFVRTFGKLDGNKIRFKSNSKPDNRNFTMKHWFKLHGAR